MSPGKLIGVNKLVSVKKAGDRFYSLGVKYLIFDTNVNYFSETIQCKKI